MAAENEEAVVEHESESKEAEAVHDPNVIMFRNLDPPVTPEEERRVRRKIDLRLPPLLCLVYICTWLDRGNLGNAALMGIQTDIGLTGASYSLAVSLFFVGTCVGDLGTNIGMRFVRPSTWISGAMCTWGAIAMLMSATFNPAGMYALRVFLGIFESAFISGAPYLFTFWYPRAEWGRRISIYLAATPVAGAFGGWIVSDVLWNTLLAF
jgi:MFS family permease